MQERSSGQWLQSLQCCVQFVERERGYTYNISLQGKLVECPRLCFIFYVLLIPGDRYLCWVLWQGSAWLALTGDPLCAQPRKHSEVLWEYREEERDYLVGDGGRICKPLTRMESSMKSASFPVRSTLKWSIESILVQTMWRRQHS